ncbi:hypothetical protein AGMMS50293_10420 [Spirochaetia bacterium]|nr:hypothetical protein AGMMS50293_10420 [Spirochaetia bacterium]
MMFEKCREILLRECELIQKAASLQKLIEEAVRNREWTDFEGHFIALNGVEQDIGLMEKEREGLFANFAAADALNANGPDLNDDKGRFYAMVSRLPAEERNELTGIYRSLKLEALKLRMANDTLMSYLSGARATLADFLEHAFPDRGGRIYTKNGAPLSHDMRSMVLNRIF